MFVVSVIEACLKKSSRKNYDVNDSKQVNLQNGGKDNKAFDIEEGRNGAANGDIVATKEDVKWTNNYVPFEGYPKGNVENEATNGKASSSSVNHIESADKGAYGGEKWKQNYVPYDDPDENKKE